jgi:DnaJ-class molecular chaperone
LSAGCAILGAAGDFMRDPYDVLGVSKSASEAEIKKAFRSLAKKHHPDTHAGDKNAQKKFQEISGAYEIVGDKEKRAKFDSGEIDASGNPRGFDPRQGGGGFHPGGPFGGGGQGARDFHFTWDNASGDAAEGFSAEDIFADLLGGRGGRGRQQPARGEDFSVSTTISFDEAARGGTRRVVVPNGEQIDVKIPVGVKDGQQVRVKGRGGAGRNGGPPGDILIQISVAPHPSMSRDGNDIRMELPVTLKEAVLGGKVSVPTLTGTVALSVPPNSNTGTTLRLKGKGIAPPNAAPGDLYVKLIVTLPDKPDADLRTFAEGWKSDYDPRPKMK